MSPFDRHTFPSIATRLAVVGAGLGLKAHYGVATAGELRWILEPTAWLVQRISGAEFPFEHGMGFVNRELRFAIAPSCAGVNFLVIAFWTLAFVILPRGAGPVRTLALAATSAAVAFAATLGVNSLRIVIALWLHARSVTFLGIDGEDLHRIEGVAIYLIALCALFWIATRAAGRIPNLWIPLGCYVAVTLALPLLNGAGARAEFWHHGGIVLGAVGVAGVLALAMRTRGLGRDGVSRRTAGVNSSGAGTSAQA